jgi:hypothetical protein
MNDKELRAIYDIVYAHECTFKAFATDIRALLADGGKGEAVAHPDDQAVDRFAQSMKEKMAAARDKGRYGWQFSDPTYLSKLLREHVEKGDPRDVANFCMMLWHHQSAIAAPQAECAPREAQPVAYLVDPGAGSAVDKFQTNKPDYLQLVDIKRRGGSVTPLYAAPTPERADADTAGASEPTAGYYYAQGWDAAEARFKNAAGASQERADAGKDAALADEQRDQAAARWATAKTPIREAMAFIDGFDAARAVLTAAGAK